MTVGCLVTDLVKSLSAFLALKDFIDFFESGIQGALVIFLRILAGGLENVYKYPGDMFADFGP